VSLVLCATAMDEVGGTYILDMGKQVRILDMARHFIRLCGLEPEKDIEIKIVGLRPGEKLYEELWTQRENPVATAHPSILCALREESFDPQLENEVDHLVLAAEKGERRELFHLLHSLVPAYSGNLPEGETVPELRVIPGTRKDAAGA
jgi:FlaA1/EpsC-like NDP-sugar epimerase